MALLVAEIARCHMFDRVAALQKTADKFRGKPFVWGRSDCYKLVRAHLRNMGHRAPAGQRYKSALGARRALTMTGHPTLEALIDSLLPRIAPAEMLPGDIALLPGEAPFDALAICVGRKLMCWREDADELVMLSVEGGAIKAAWRV